MEMKISIGFQILCSLAQASFSTLSGNEEEINKPATAPNEPVTLKKVSLAILGVSIPLLKAGRAHTWEENILGGLGVGVG